MQRKLATLFLASCSVLAWGACGGSGDDSTFMNGSSSGEGGSTNVPPGFGGDTGGGTSGGDPGDGSLGTCATGCTKGALCKYDVCVPNLGACTSNDTCPGDSYCDTDKTCVPYGVPAGKINDPTCQRGAVPGDIQPTVQCEWAKPAAGDSTKDYVSSYTTPMVADLNLDHDPNKLQPSVVITTWTSLPSAADPSKSERIGMIRVFDGRTCEEQMRIGGPDDPEFEANRPTYAGQIAIGDLDGDVPTGGSPEIVTMHRAPGPINGDNTTAKAQVIAYKVDTSGTKPRLVRKWVGRTCGATPAQDKDVFIGSNSDNYGPGIWDVDDDGKPEVVLDDNVFDANGCLLNPPGKYQTYLNLGVMSTIADVDLDGQPDLVRANGIWGWNKTTKQWDIKPWFVAKSNQLPGHVAVVDMGLYSAIPGHPATDKLPEIIVVSSPKLDSDAKSTGQVRVQKITGEIVFGPVPIFTTETDSTKDAFYGGRGGPPTASDFDGDGYPEFAAAANAQYTVYDPDCDGVGAAGGVAANTAAVRPGGKCMRPDYMKTLPPAVSLSGVLWGKPSQDFSSNSTGSSIFDFNGDGKSEAVYRDECYLRVYEGATGKVIFSAPASSGTGYEYPVIVDVDGDFATEIVVPRATNNPGCPAVDPLAPPLAPGQTAPVFESKGGFVVLRDPQDRWLPSRPIWNQHAYSITNVTDDGRIPKGSEVLRNWEQPGVNNFRQNTQGALGKLALADLTAQISDLSGLCSNQSGAIPLTTRVCNRGTNPVQDGVTIAFYATMKGAASFDAAGAASICSSKTQTLLKVGDCTTVMCTGNVPANADVYVVTDPAGEVADCHPGNNNGASARVLCSSVQ